jgi:drug/metabolite transporter (DMT)-like permease
LNIEGLALITSVSNAISAVLVAKGLSDSDPPSACLLTTAVQALALLILSAFRTPILDWTAIVLFALNGLFALWLGRLLYFVAVERIGVAASSAIIGSNPLLSTLLAVIFLGEQVGQTTLAGVILVVLGVFLISGTGKEAVKLGPMVIPLLSALSYAVSNVLRKAALNVQPEPLLGAQVASVSGTLGLLGYLMASGRLSQLKVDRRDLGYFTSAGVVAAAGWLAFMMATEGGPVSVVTTIVFSYPLFSLLLSWVFLRKEERLTLRLVAGCLVIVIGVVLVSVF